MTDEAEKVGQRRAEARRKWDKIRSNPGTNCEYCDFTGWVTAEAANFDKYAFRCTSCNVATELELSSSIPAWSEDFEGRVKRLRFKAI